MKNMLINTIFIGLFIITACKKDRHSVFDKTADERRSEEMTAIKNQLMEAKDGWIIFVSSRESGASYQFYGKFLDDQKMELQDLTLYGKNQKSVEDYRIEAGQGTTFLFPTGGLFSKASEMAIKDSGSLFSKNNFDLIDFEFGFDKVGTDTITLMGTYSRSPMTMIRATPESVKQYFDDYYEFRKNLFLDGPIGSPAKKYVPPAGRFNMFKGDVYLDEIYSFLMEGLSQPYVVTFNAIKNSFHISLVGEDGSLINRNTSGWYFNKTSAPGFSFFRPIHLDAENLTIQTLTDFKSIYKKAITKTYDSTVTDYTKSYITHSDTPLLETTVTFASIDTVRFSAVINHNKLVTFSGISMGPTGTSNSGRPPIPRYTAKGDLIGIWPSSSGYKWYQDIRLFYKDPIQNLF